MTNERLKELFSAKRISGYASEAEHRDNFLLMQRIAPKIGILEIITRNKVAEILDITDDDFISKQSLGYWVKTIDAEKIHNALINLRAVDFRKYSSFNRLGKSDIPNFKKVGACYWLILTIRNRAFHFENLYKLNDNGAPRIITKLNNEIIGVAPEMIEAFINDFLAYFGDDVRGYL